MLRFKCCVAHCLQLYVFFSFFQQSFSILMFQFVQFRSSLLIFSIFSLFYFIWSFSVKYQVGTFFQIGFQARNFKKFSYGTLHCLILVDTHLAFLQEVSMYL